MAHAFYEVPIYLTITVIILSATRLGVLLVYKGVEEEALSHLPDCHEKYCDQTINTIIVKSLK